MTITSPSLQDYREYRNWMSDLKKVKFSEVCSRLIMIFITTRLSSVVQNFDTVVVHSTVY